MTDKIFFRQREVVIDSAQLHLLEHDRDGRKHAQAVDQTQLDFYYRETPLHRFLRPRGYRPLPVRADVSTLLEFNELSAHVQDGEGRTPLHVACANRLITIDIIELLLGFHPKAALVQDQRGQTPLHLVCIQPRESAIALLVERTPEACSILDENGATPLHYACSSLASTNHRSLYHLVSHNPSIALAPDKHGDTPFSIFCDRYQKIYQRAVSLYPATKEAVILTILPNLRKSFALVDAIHFNLVGRQMITSAITYDNTLHHTLLSIRESNIMSSNEGRKNAKLLIYSIVRLCRSQVRNTDENDNLPLHLATLFPCLNDITVGEFLFSFQEDPPIIENLIGMCPQAAFIPNQNGDLPFHIFAKAGGKWHQGAVFILRAYPTPIINLDVDCRLMPRVLSRASKDLGLDVLYQSLKDKPHLCCCNEPS